jgi:hypothetical protein
VRARQAGLAGMQFQLALMQPRFQLDSQVAEAPGSFLNRFQIVQSMFDFVPAWRPGYGCRVTRYRLWLPDSLSPHRAIRVGLSFYLVEPARIVLLGHATSREDLTATPGNLRGRA